MSHSKRAQAALARLPEVDPGVAGLALWCAYRDSPEATHTRGDTIHLGPEFARLPISEQTGLLAHHVLHVALRHSARRADARQRFGNRFREGLYTMACDALVNEALLQGNHALPRPAIRAAEIVRGLPDAPDNVLTEWDSDRLYAALVGAGRGDGADGDAEAQSARGDLRDSDPARADAEVWAARVEQALREGQRAGRGIGAALARFGDLPKATTPWEILLRRRLAKALAQHPQRSHRRPDRAWLARDALARQTNGAQPAFEPGLARESRRPRLVIGLDTSSSIPDDTLGLFAAEAISIVRRTGAEAHLLGFDTEVHTRGRFDRAEAIAALSMRRGGGTDFTEILREAQAVDPTLIIVLTDLDAPLPDAPAAPVLWAVPGTTTRPAFGDILKIGD
ncbi:MAG: VWA-like domain-containing protein [Pseudomonadota bacterium]